MRILSAPSSQSFGVAGVPLLSIEKKNGGRSANAKVYSQDKRIVAEIRDNRFEINATHYFRRERPRKHTLLVYDPGGDEVLNMDDLNASAVESTGRFFYPNRAPIIVGATYIKMRETTSQQECLGVPRQAIISID